MAGTGTVTPIASISTGLAQALPKTCLPLLTYARIMGIHPAHFLGLAGGSIFPVTGQCSDVWWQHSWQAHDRVSREDLAYVIQEAEREIESVLGYSVCPTFHSKEMHRYPQHFRRDTFGNGRNTRGQYKSIKAKSGKFIEAGQRAVTLIGTATLGAGTLALSDPDGDGFNELVTITLPASLSDACEIKAYPPDYSGQEAWEIRPAKSKTITGGNVILQFDRWQIVKPDNYETFPTNEDVIALDPTDNTNFLTSIEVYREYTDFSQSSAEFSWTPDPSNFLNGYCGSCSGTGCTACSNTTQTGCVHVRDVNLGLVVPVPATYDADSGTWSQSTFTECREPDTVKIWYKAGELSQTFLSGQSCNPMEPFLAQAIAWMATARIERNFCGCGNTLNLVSWLREDLAKSDDAGSFNTDFDLLGNPFGTKRGEIMAWQKISNLTEMIAYGALA